MLASGQASSTCMAQALGLSVRTMQRRLGASGPGLLHPGQRGADRVGAALPGQAQPLQGGDLAEAGLQRAECVHAVVQWAVWDGAAEVARAGGIYKK